MEGEGDCVRPYRLEYTSLVVPIYGVISPVCILLTVVTNCLVCVVLLRPHMRSPTNALLVAMAVSDTLTGLCPLPCFIYFYSAGHHVTPVPYAWCDAYFYLVDYLPTIFHTASVWLTVALAAQRYICVCQPAKALACCGSRSVGGVIISVYAVATISQVSRLFEIVVTPVVLDLDASLLRGEDQLHHDTVLCEVSAAWWASESIF